MSHPIDEINEGATFPVQLSYQGIIKEVDASIGTTVNDLVNLAKHIFFPSSTNETSIVQLKLLYKGRRLEASNDSGASGKAVFVSLPSKIPRIIILASESAGIEELNSKRSDPTIRGFDQEKLPPPKSVGNADHDNHWGPLLSRQDKNFKFCRFEHCSWQSFGHRPGDSTPHDFAARSLLLKLATDPGIVAIVKDRELTVGILGEMDPIDDRLMQKKKQQGACLLGYNTNAGYRIDIKLRTDDLKSFRPYHQLASTLIHELSHNWIGDHNYLFWTNYGQMMAEYCATHTFATAGIYIQGKSTAQIAGLPQSVRSNMDSVHEYVMDTLRHEMIPHGLDATAIAPAIRKRCDELVEQRGYGNGFTLHKSTTILSNSADSREMALLAAERRQREHQQKEEDAKKKFNNQDSDKNRL